MKDCAASCKTFGDVCRMPDRNSARYSLPHDRSGNSCSIGSLKAGRSSTSCSPLLRLFCWFCGGGGRKQRFVVALGLMLILTGTYYLLDVLVETDREKLVSTVQQMAATAKHHDTESLMGYISEEFRHLASQRDKRGLYDLVNRHINGVQDVRRIRY